MSEPADYIVVGGDYEQMDQSELMDTDATDDCDIHWDHDSIVLLLNLYVQNLEKFRNPKLKKKSLWNDISKTIGKGPYGCDKKYRNLKQTYVRLLKKKTRDGIETVKWPYFEIFETIYTKDGEYCPEIQQVLESSTNDSVAKALLSLKSVAKYHTDVNGESSKSQNEQYKRKVDKKKYAEFKKVTTEMRDRQRVVEEKLDRLINIVEESNNIQKERNRLFEQFLEKVSRR